MHPLWVVRRALPHGRDHHGAGRISPRLTVALFNMNHIASTTPVPRRGFLQLTFGWLAAGFAVAASAAASVRFLVPNVLFEPSLRFKAGKPDEYADGSVTFLEEERVFLVRQGNTFRCLSAVCTHLGCTVNRSDHGYHCPCHGSVFDDQGTVKSGPA